MGHLDAKAKNQVAGMIGGAILDGLLMAATGVQSDSFTRTGSEIGAMAYSKQFETEADYVGLYFMSRAGFDLSGAENFWRRMGAEMPKSITFASTHPTAAERFIVIAKTRAEIVAIAAPPPATPPATRAPAKAPATTQTALTP